MHARTGSDASPQGSGRRKRIPLGVLALAALTGAGVVGAPAGQAAADPSGTASQPPHGTLQMPAGAFQDSFGLPSDLSTLSIVPCSPVRLPVNPLADAGQQPTGTRLIRNTALEGRGRTQQWTFPMTVRRHASVGYLAVTKVNVGLGRYNLDVLNQGITRSARLSDQIVNPRTVAAVNGDYWDLNNYTTLRGAQIRRDAIDKAYREPTYVVGMTRDNLMGTAAVRVQGVLAQGTLRTDVAAVNGHAIPSSGVNVFTHQWGSLSRPFPTGTVEALVQRNVGGRDIVRAIAKSTGARKGGLLGQVPAGYAVLSARGTTGAGLARLTLGKGVVLSYASVWSGPKLSDAIGRGLVIATENRHYTSRCTASTENLRPRTVIAWASGGHTAWLITVNTTYRTTDGVRYGGASVWTMADIALRLGASDAVMVDGGTSTTMLIRPSVSRTAPSLRVDVTSNAPQRQVVNGLGFTAR